MRFFVVLFFVPLFLLSLTTTAIHAQTPPDSTYIDDITWDSGNVFTAAQGSDLWPNTWADDGNIYTGWGDGGGFGGTNDSGRVVWGTGKITATNPTGLIESCANGSRNLIDVNGGLCPENSSSDIEGYINGIISIGGRLYVWLNMEPGDPTHVYRLAYSDDHGATWTKSSVTFDIDFAPKSFIQYGQDYALAPDNYVYMYANPYDDPSAGYNMTHVYLIRVDKNSLTDKSAYRYYAGLDGSNNPIWSATATDRVSVLDWGDGINIPHVVWNPGLNRFIMSGYKSPGNLGVFEASNPWGTWYTVQTNTNWLSLGSSLQNGSPLGLIAQFVTKWTSSDGLSTQMIFSCYGCNTANHDRFNLVGGTFSLFATPTPSPTPTPTPTPTPSPTPTPTATPSPTPTDTPTPAPTATPQSDSGTSSSYTEPSAPGCRDQAPLTAPDLFQIDVNNTQAILYFTPAQRANNYFLSYAVTQNAEQFGAQFDTGISTGVLSYTVNLLNPNTTYYFKLRGGNGCMPGNWSSVMSAKTKATSIGATSYYKNFVARVLSLFPKQTSLIGAGSGSQGTNPNPSVGCINYTIKGGNTLWQLAAQYLGSGFKFREIMAKNNLKTTLLRIGQVVQIGC